MKTFPQITWDEYMYKRSIAQLRFMAADSTHVHYMKGHDKRIWENYQECLKGQAEMEKFLSVAKEGEKVII